MAIISIFYGVYSHGEELAAELADKLGYRIIDGRLLDKVQSEFGISARKIEQTFKGTLSPFSRFTNEREKNTAKIKKALAELVQEDGIMITGYSTHLIPRTITHMLKVCVIANMDYRIRLAQDADNLSVKEAANVIHRDDRFKSSWTEFLHASSPFDEKLYDMVIPMQSTSVSTALEMILQQVASDAVKTTKLSRKAAADFLTAAKIQLQLADEGHFPDVYAEDGVITLLINKYVLRLERYEAELKRIVGSMDGVEEVICKTGPRFNPPPIMPMGDIEAPSKILLVDDEKEFVHTLSERLSTRNLESSIVYNGEEALDFVRRDEPDVMVLDLKMPGIDGIEVLRRVKREHPNVEVIILTGHGSEKEESLAEELGAFAYLHKPVNIDLLAQAMKEAYKKVNEKKRRMQSASGEDDS